MNSLLNPSFNPDACIDLQTPIQPPEEFLGPWLRRGELLMLYAPRGVGKTRVGAKIAHCLASGSSFLKWTPQRLVKAVYFDGEMGREALGKVLLETELGALKSMERGHLKYYPCDQFKDQQLPDLSHPKGQELYDKLSLGAEVIIIDNILTSCRFHGPRDNDFMQWQRVKPWLIKKRSQGATVLLIHHSGKSGDQLGTSDREVILNTVIKLTDSDLVLKDDFITKGMDWHFTKKRAFHGEVAQPLYVEFKEVEGKHIWTYQNYYEKRKDMLLKLASEFDEKTAQEMLGLSRIEAKRIFKEGNSLSLSNTYQEQDYTGSQDDYF